MISQHFCAFIRFDLCKYVDTILQLNNYSLLADSVQNPLQMFQTCSNTEQQMIRCILISSISIYSVGSLFTGPALPPPPQLKHGFIPLMGAKDNTYSEEQLCE